MTSCLVNRVTFLISENSLNLIQHLCQPASEFQEASKTELCLRTLAREEKARFQVEYMYILCFSLTLPLLFYVSINITCSNSCEYFSSETCLF